MLFNLFSPPREVFCFYTHMQCGPITWQPIDLLEIPTPSAITEALADIQAPAGVPFESTEELSAVQRDTLKVSFGSLRPPSKDLSALGTACGKATAGTFPGSH